MSVKEKHDKNWDIVVKPKVSLFQLNLKDVWAYKDLILLLVKRDFVSQYKQTLLGPVWAVVQPLMSTFMFTVTFSKIAGLTTQGVPAFLYYLTGLTFWNYFADSITKNANTFSANAAIFGKVYFPRLVMPFSVIISCLLRLSIQLIILLLVWAFSYFTNTGSFQPNLQTVFLLPLVILVLGLMGSSIGLVVTSLTTKYRDFNFLIGYLVQFMMYLSCVVLALPEKGLTRELLMFNPVVPLMEYVKHVFLGVGNFSPFHMIYSLCVTVVAFLAAILVFNKTEKTFMDTV